MNIYATSASSYRDKMPPTPFIIYASQPLKLIAIVECDEEIILTFF